MAVAAEPKTPGSYSHVSLGHSNSNSLLRKTGEATLASGGSVAYPQLPRYLDVHKLTKQRKLSRSTGNLHGFMAEDYSRTNWPLPKMFGFEKYGYSLIDIDDPRYVKDCAEDSKKLIRLYYDMQIIDLEWRKAHKALLDAEHRQATLPRCDFENVSNLVPDVETAVRRGTVPGGAALNVKAIKEQLEESAQRKASTLTKAVDKSKAQIKKEVDSCMEYLLELQEQKDLYEQQVRDVFARCAAIKASIKKENDLEDLRRSMEGATKSRISPDSDFWNTKFKVHLRDSAFKSAVGVVDLKRI